MVRLTFEPVRYCNPICFLPPSLMIALGDTVASSSVDGCGFDARDKQVAHSGNPMTGSFDVEGAAPGDRLGVRIDRPRPIRRRGLSFKVVWLTAVKPE